MIDTVLIRAKVLEQAVMGELSNEFDSNVDSLFELKKETNRNIEETNDDVPYELKEGWHWIALSELGSDDKHSFADGPFGSNLKKEHYTENAEVRIIQLSNVGELGWKNDNVKYTTFEHLVTIQRSEVVPGNIVIAKMMPAGRAIIVPDIDEKYVLSSDCVKFVPCEFLNVEYLCYAINSSMFRKQVLQDVHGIGRERTSLSKLKTYLLPIPCRAEQDYIVEKINKAYEQLALLDIFQAQYSSDLEVLKSKIIDAGIQGKLTEQLPEDGTAEELLEQIAEEKKLLIKEKKIKATKALPEITEDEIPFEIPDNWKWVRVSDVFSVINGDRGKNYPAKSTLMKEGNIPFISAINIDGYSVVEDEKLFYLSEEQYEKLSSGKMEVDDVIVCIRGSLGKHGINHFEKGAIASSLIICRACFQKEIMARYLLNYLKAGLFVSEIRHYNSGVAQPNLAANNFEKFIFPLAPLEEQKRIVEKIEEMLSLIQ